jgi:glyoxylate/hydroxypyruvate reductase A
MHILLATDFSHDETSNWLQALSVALPDDRFITARDGLVDASIDVALVANAPPGALAGLPALRLIQSLWAGVNVLLADPGLPSGVPIARMVDPAMNDAMAQTALWAVLSLHRGFFDYAQRQRQRIWQVDAQRRADEIGVAVLGLGEIGTHVASCLARHGYRVEGWSRRAKSIDGVHCHVGDAALDGVLANVQIVINLLPLTAATTGLFDKHTLGTMQKGASLVNLARGAHVVEEDLLAALDAGQLGHVVLDVFATEPLPSYHRFWRHAKVIVLPHAAAQTDPRSAANVVAANLHALREGRPLMHLVERARGY